jgi:hypothetical protein
MIIVKLFQGFGNQMFQYAYARALSIRFRKELKFDVSWYTENSAHRAFMLDNLKLQYLCATDKEIYDTKTCNGPNIITYKWNQLTNKVAPYYKKSIVKESLNTCFDPNLLKTNSNSYIEGYFASELYFKEIADIIKQEFEIKSQATDCNKTMMQQMQQRNSVCISIRRGDFVKNPMHDVCDLNYFYGSIAYISQKISDPYFYVFSDDNTWVQDNFKTDFPHEFVTHNYPNFLEDFRMMQACKHHIIPNSTFSWWAAWLAEKQESIIIAPQKWLNTTDIDYAKVVPERWIKRDNQSSS